MVLTKRRGFTVVELIVVFAVLMVIAAIALPAFAHLRDNAATEVCQYNRQQITEHYTVYRMMHAIGDDRAAAEFATFLAANYSNDGGCPTGGMENYYLDEDTLAVLCRDHEDTELLPEDGDGSD